MSGKTIALFGRRQVGKSHVADHLVKDHGFIRLHPFNPGKAGCRKVYEKMGASAEEARRMTDTDLKDVPSAFLPERDHETAHDALDPDFFAKAFCEGYLEYLGIPAGEVHAMINGKLHMMSDDRIPDGGTPASFLSRIKDFAENSLWDEPKAGDFRSPKTQNLSHHPKAAIGHYTSRHVMERMGTFLGVDLGPEWTLNAEIARSARVNGESSHKVIESIVYEASHLAEADGLFLVKITSDREVPIESPESDAFVQTISPDAVFHNDFSGLDSLGARFDETMARQGVLYGQPACHEEPRI